MFSVKKLSKKLHNGKSSIFRISRTLSFPTFEGSSKQEKNSSRNSIRHLSREKSKKKGKMERETEEENVAGLSRSSKAHRSNRRHQPHSRHGHKCHKTKHKSTESLHQKIDNIRHKNYISNKKVGEGEDEEVLQSENLLSPFEMNITAAYQHLKTENEELREEIQKLREEGDEMKETEELLKGENSSLRNDVLLMQNLVYKLNVELEKYQTGTRKPVTEGDGGGNPADRLPKNFDKNFLKPVLPLLKAYSESIKEKEETIKILEEEYKRFHAAFGDLLQENERLYVELEKKFISSDGVALTQIKVLKKDLEMAKQENNLLFQQIKLEKEKLMKVQLAFKDKVEDASKEKEGLKNDAKEYKEDLLVIRGKYSVLKQEFERLKMDNDSRVPMAVYSASIYECRKLFQELKNEYENENQRLNKRIKEQEEVLRRRSRQEEKWAEEKNYLEKSNFNQILEIETLAKKVSELEKEQEKGGCGICDEKTRKELNDSRKQLREANQKVENISKRLGTTKKQLQKAMTFAEDVVRQQETLLQQLHEKQKENNYMTTQFGTLRTQIKDVERGAQEDLNTIEDKIKYLENENHALMMHNRKLEKLLMEKEDLIKQLEPTRDSTS